MTASRDECSFFNALELLLKHKLEFPYTAVHCPLSCRRKSGSGVQGSDYLCCCKCR